MTEPQQNVRELLLINNASLSATQRLLVPSSNAFSSFINKYRICFLLHFTFIRIILLISLEFLYHWYYFYGVCSLLICSESGSILHVAVRNHNTAALVQLLRVGKFMIGRHIPISSVCNVWHKYHNCYACFFQIIVL